MNIRKKEREKERKKWVTCGLGVIYLQHTIEEGRKVIKELMSIYWHNATAKQPVGMACQQHIRDILKRFINIFRWFASMSIQHDSLTRQQFSAPETE